MPYSLTVSKLFWLQSVFHSVHGCHMAYDLGWWWNSVSKLGHFCGCCVDVKANVKFPVHRMFKRRAGYLSQYSKMDDRSICVRFPTGAEKCMFFYAEIGESMYLRIFGKFLVVCTASRRRKR
jgi:hypothetical protein